MSLSISELRAEDSLTPVLLNEMKANQSASFQSLLPNWENKYGNKALRPLFEIASNLKNEDSHRYIALMSATKMGGPATLPLLKKLLKDRSWMIRSGALRALTLLNSTDVTQEVLPLLRDPALVVRVEAIETLLVLRPKGVSDALLAVIHDRENYHGKKAQWVPQKALVALAHLNAKEVLPKLQTLLHDPNHQNDPELLRQTRQTIESLSK